MVSVHPLPATRSASPSGGEFLKHPPVGGCVHIIYNTYYITIYTILIQWGAPMLLDTAFGIHRADQYLWGQDYNQHFAGCGCIT